MPSESPAQVAADPAAPLPAKDTDDASQGEVVIAINRGDQFEVGRL
jgi:hypothetical protein